ncbi:cytosolic endo-beta-N-acetylglucosaminidase 1-like [Populus alba x Populus x berolinensis]|nr:cytosolic endo-beta-N-acetylglucosaminidase 1-like [Populus alba x Populus x berolinensis]
MSVPQEHQSSTVDPPPPPPFDPTQPSIPISYPIKTLEDLGSRAYFKSFHYPFNICSVPLENSVLDNRPRVLVCHDMQGGYVDDKWIQGGSNPDAYAIWHWYLIDVFVYFSHNLVTLPPPCWTNTAHRHGVKVLGTFITEWDEGKAICNKLLSTKESAHMYAELLSELAVALGFDGWLLNMEVELELGQIPNLKEFISHLTQTMHSSLPGSLVIWYDSVTIDGNLSWQNQLNDQNKPFFDICDGIFVNYTWQEDYPRSSAAVAGDRKFDVYMGIDVFGRSTYGGGQWTTNVALDVLKKDDVSAAIFAPGWVYETKQPPDFQTAQNHWWSLVEKSWGAVKFYPRTLPFYSNFDQGHGYHISVEGGQVSDAPWNNISSQGFQPFLKFTGKPSPGTIEVFVDFKEASYRGGGNITFKGTLEENTDFTTKIFQGELLMDAVPLHITHSVKSEGDSLLGLSLHFSSTANERTSVLLASWGTNQFSRKFSKIIAPCQVNKPRTAPGWVVLESSIDMNGYTLTEIHAVCYRPKHEHSQLGLEHRTDGSEDTLTYNPKEYHAVLGHITMNTSKENTYFPPSSSWLVEGHYIKWSSGSQGSKNVSVKIDWKSKDGTASQFPKYNIYVEKLPKQAVRNHGVGLGGVQEYLGVANVEAFYVSELPIPATTSSLKFIIQVCGVDGVCQNLDDSPYFQLDVKATTVGGRKMFQLFSCVERNNLINPLAHSTNGQQLLGCKSHGKLGIRHFEWFDSLICERSKAVNRGLLQSTSRMEIRELLRLPSRETKIWAFMILSMVFVILLCTLSNGKGGKETLVFP